MTIDTNELRRLAQAALVGPDGISLNWVKLLQDFQQKANPAVISELLDRLEAAEKERDECNSRRLEAADHFAAQTALMKEKCAALRAEIEELLDLIAAVKKRADAEFRLRVKKEEEHTRLRAKIAEMEKQEPVAWMLNCQTLGGDTGWILSWTQSGAGLCNRLQGEENEKRLYALPGAQTQGEEK